MKMINTIKLDNLFFYLQKIEVLHKVNAEDYTKRFFEIMGYKVEKYDSDIGCPDFYVFNGDEAFFVEVKTNGDGLRHQQISWIINHPDKNVVIFFLCQEIYKKKLDKINAQRKRREEEFIKTQELHKKAIEII